MTSLYKSWVKLGLCRRRELHEARSFRALDAKDGHLRPIVSTVDGGSGIIAVQYAARPLVLVLM